MRVFTIGYEGLDIERFTALLAEHEVDTVVDVRQLPLSRKRGFSKQALAGALREAGFGYVHMVALGCPRPVRDQHKKDHDWGRYTEGFMAHLAEQGPAVAELSERVRDSACALLCYEADYRFCHRSMVAEAVREQCGAEVIHLQAPPPEARQKGFSFQ